MNRYTDSFTLHQQARAHRSRLVGLMLSRLVRALVRGAHGLTLTATRAARPAGRQEG